MFGKKEKALRRTTAIGALMAGVAAISSPAAAQAQEQPPAPAPAQTETQEEEDIVVTGSRIRRNEFTSSSPVQIITAEQNSLEGLINTSEILQGSTVASGSQQINNQFTGFVTEGGPGVNTVSLRGLGANRTLVLLNGRRLNPAGARGQVGAVDTNVIPESMIERVEILKDGASSIYGSDAVAGVINIITTQDLDGGVLEATGSLSEQGGGEEYQLSGAWGHVGDRAQGIISFEYYRQEALNWGDRDYLSCAQDMVREGGPDGRILDIVDPATGQSKCFNLLQGVVDDLSFGGRFLPDPTAVDGGGPFGFDRAGYRIVGLSYNNVNALCLACVTDADVEAAWRANQAAVPTNSPFYGSRTAISPVDRFTLFATGTLDIGAGAELYGEAMYNRRESEQNSLRQLFPTINPANPLLPPAFAGGFTRSIVQLPFINTQEVSFVRAVGGVRGDFGGFMDDGPLSDWSYDFFVQSGYSDATYGSNFIYNDRVFATTGPTACTTNPATDNIFNPGNLSNFDCSIGGVDYISAAVNGFTPAESAFLFGFEEGTTQYTQTLVSGSITGDLFELPAGAVSLALGTEWREESIDDRPGVNSQLSNSWGLTSAGRTAGSDSVLELFGEAEVPILANVPLFESLTFNGSYRWTDYESYGEGDTYKLGLNWQITPEYRLRGTFGTSYRAPALFELFLANQTGFQGQVAIDPCVNWDNSNNPQIVTNCGPNGLNLPPDYAGNYPSALIITGGGAGALTEETSEATTFGLIWTPNWSDLSIAVDYFRIEVLNEVAQFGSANIVGACMSDPNWPNSPFCSLFTRDEDPNSLTFGMIQTVNNSYINLDTQNTEGLDVTLRYEHEFSFGTFRMDFQGTWTFEDSFAFAATTGDPILEDFNGEIVDPDFTGSVDLRFDRGDWTFFWDVDMVSKASNTEDFGGDVFGWRATPFPAYYKQYTEAYAIHSPSIRYRTDTWTFQFGSQNVFDEPPPTISTASFFARIGNFPLTNQYDIIGRTYWASIGRRW